MSINKLKDFIVVVKKAVSAALCDGILNEYKDCDDWADALAGRSGGNVDKKSRNCQVIYTSQPENLAVSTKRTQLDDELFKAVSECLKKYVGKFNTCTVSQDTGYDLLKYSTGGFYVQHTDAFFEHPRETSCSLVLNDDFEGGEFAFFDRELKYKLGKGDVLMFPSNFMFPHEVMEVTKGTRYAVITWFR